MAAIADNPVVEDTLVHVFFELPLSLKQDCEICKKGTSGLSLGAAWKSLAGP